ncbi:MAG: hypothetical protein A2Z43_04110 [Syntrophobacterales bacterium RBG_19FT_COMBO_59_10]|nr:MAG: hypothetical protein A2Z43_04110 [Syntrophobacterales bacterium RBG_19FT_COMBO_59_10]
MFYSFRMGLSVLYDRKLLVELSRCTWESLKVFLQEAVHENNPIPGAVIAIQSFGDFLGFNPQCHILVTDGCFYGNGMFRVAPPLELKKLEAIFRQKVFRMLLAKGKITRELIAMLSSHSPAPSDSFYAGPDYSLVPFRVWDAYIHA